MAVMELLLIGAYVDYGWYIFKNSEGGLRFNPLYNTRRC